jgi:glucose/arabinose dehydrogenase
MNSLSWSRVVMSLSAALLLACSKPSVSSQQRPPKIERAGGQGEATKPWVGAASGVPVETAPPNVPEFKPAFPQQTRAPALQTRTAIAISEIAGDLDQPWALAFLPDRRMLVTEKHNGRLYIVAPDGKKSAPAEGVPRVDGEDQGGLLDVELGPDYAQSKLVYLSYYEPREGGNGLAVARARLVDGATPKLEALKIVFRMQPTLESNMHAGGRLVFAPDGALFVTLGDRSIMKGRVQARDLASDFGKIVRILPDGSIPKDNPFVNTPGGSNAARTTAGRRSATARNTPANASTKPRKQQGSNSRSTTGTP